MRNQKLYQNWNGNENQCLYWNRKKFKYLIYTKIIIVLLFEYTNRFKIKILNTKMADGL